MKRTDQNIRILHALMMISATYISATAQGWEGPKCREVVMAGNEYKFKVKSIDEMITAIESTDIDHLNGKQVRSPWEMGMIPNLSARKLGYQFQLKMIAAWAKFQKPVQSVPVDQFITQPKANEITRSILMGDSQALNRLPILNDQLTLLASAPQSDRKDLQDVGLIEELGFCAYYQPFGAVECYQALQKILNEMAPVENITARSEIYEVLTSDDLRKPLSDLALDYMNAIEFGLPMKGRHLDSDLSRVLKTDQQKWLVLAVLSARGANFYKLFGYASRSNFQTMAALGVIASASLYFDQVTSDERFSYPASVRVGCDTGKSYHFWMAAYLTQRFGSKWAAYLSAVAYQMRSDTEFRKPDRIFREKWNSIASQKIRLDLAYAAAGAEYAEGLRNGVQRNLDVDQKLNLLENGSEMLKPMDATEVEGYWSRSPFSAFRRWNRIFHPEKVLE
jgi:hypothetical protein